MTDDNDNQEELQSELFHLSQYMAASAEGLRDEPKHYGPLRLLEVLKRLARLMSKEYDDEFMSQIAQDIEDNKGKVMTNKEEFYSFVNNLVIEFAREAKTRSSE